MKWENIDKNWKIVLTQAWESYTNCTFPIGAVIVNRENEVIATGRNTIYEKKNSDNPVCGHQLGHAELNALLKVSKHDHPNITSYTLYSSLEPCLGCFGAFVMSRVKQLKYLAKDSFAGAADVRDKNNYVAQRGIRVKGPYPVLDFFQMVLIAEYIIRFLPRDIPRIFPKWEKDYPAAIEIAFELNKTGVLKKLQKERAPIDKVWNTISQYAYQQVI